MSFSWDVGGGTISGPSWEQMVDQAAELLGFEDAQLLRARGTGLQILEYFKLVNGNNLDKLKNWLVRKLDAPDDYLRKSVLHNALASLTKCSTYYTTNYDNFLERSLQLNGRNSKAVAQVSDMASTADVEVVKFHGDFEHMDKMVMTESDYEERMSLETALDFRLRSDALNRALLFIGYSFRDPNVSYLFHKLNRTFEKLPASHHGTRGFILYENPSNFEKQLFRERNIEVIPIDVLNRAASAADVLTDMIK